MSQEIYSSLSHETKYDEPRLPTFEEAITEERLLMERSQLMEATKQLARLQMDMETRVRVEMEAKIRVEMEMKMRMEMVLMEEERKEQEKHRQLVAIKKERRDKLVASYRDTMSRYDGDAQEMYRSVIDFITKNDVLSYTLGCFDITSPARRVYMGLYLAETHLGVHMVCEKNEEIRPLYWFASELTQRDLAIWDNFENRNGYYSPLVKKDSYLTHNMGLTSVIQSITYHYGAHFGVANNCYNKPDHEARVVNKQMLTDFQTIVHLIPGGYQNGPWRALDGFFGPYLNEETLEITTIAPLRE